MPLHGLGGVVVGFETLRHLRRHFIPGGELGVHKIEDMIEAGGFAEEQILDVSLQFDILDTLEPDEFALVGTIEEGSTESLRFADTDSVPFSHFTDDLHVGIFIVQFGDAVKATAVDILIGILPYHIERGVNAKLFTKNVGTLSTDILTIGYISIR